MPERRDFGQRRREIEHRKEIKRVDTRMVY